MNSIEFWRLVDCQMPDEQGPVVVVDAEGFVHDVVSLYWDAESKSWVIRTAWKGHE